jgi:hypothetical protein
MSVEEQNVFNNRKYTCCCGACGIATGAKILCIIEIILSVLSIPSYIGLHFNGYPAVYCITNDVLCILMIVFAACGFYGVVKMNLNFVLASAVYHGLSLAIAAFMVLAIMLTVVTNVWYDFVLLGIKDGIKDLSDEDAILLAENVYRPMVASVVTVAVICLLLNTWFFLIMRTAYIYVRDVVKFDADMSSGPSNGTKAYSILESQANASHI